MSRRDRNGFTLLEILVAVAVLGLLLLALAQGTQFGFLALRKQSESAARHNELAAVDRTIRRLIERTIAGDYLVNQVPLSGGAAGIELFTVLPDGPATLPDPTVAARLGVDAHRRLVLRWLPHPHADWIGPPPAPAEAVLLSNVERLEIAYWQSVPGGGGDWMRDWQARDPPSLVRIRIVFPAGDPRHWPDIIAAPRVDHAV